MNGLAIVQSYQSLGPGEGGTANGEIRSYRGAEYPIGPSAFSGSLANRVDRISTIDYDQDDLDCDNREAENVLVYEENKTEDLKNTEMEQNIFTHQISVPIITMEEEGEENQSSVY